MNKEVLTGATTFRYISTPFPHSRSTVDVYCRDSFREMLKSVCDNGHNFHECQDILRQSEIIPFCLDDGMLI